MNDPKEIQIITVNFLLTPYRVFPFIVAILFGFSLLSSL